MARHNGIAKTLHSACIVCRYEGLRETLPLAAALCVLCAALCLAMLGGSMSSDLACSPLHRRELVSFIECRQQKERAAKRPWNILSGPLQNTSRMWHGEKPSHQ